jgi:hypothetical protein
MAYKLGKDESKKAFYKNADASPSPNPNPNTNLEDNEPQVQVQEQEKDYVSVVKKVKKENITPENIGEIMLCQIPGISSVTALTIMEKYQTLPNLIKELEINPDCMKDVCSTNAKGQTRKINKTSIANIVKFLIKK